MRASLLRFTASLLLSSVAVLAQAEQLPIEVLSAVVKNQKIAGAQVLLQKNGAQTVVGTTDAQGQVTLTSDFADDGDSLLIIGAGCGVGSILVQLARQLPKLTVIGTASRPETRDWVKDLGAHHVIDHSQPLVAQLDKIGVGQVSHVASLTHTDSYFAQLIDALRPQGKLALIDDPKTLDVVPMKRKALSLHWELMFTRSLYETPDMIAQHELLNRVSTLIDEGVLKTTLGEHFGTINAQNLRRAHAVIESGKARGKIVLEGF